MIHRLICRLFGQHSMYRVYEEDYPDYAHMKCWYCGTDEWHSEHGCVPTPAPWPKCPERVLRMVRVGDREKLSAYFGSEWKA